MSEAAETGGSVQCLGHPEIAISETAPCPECGAVPADWFIDAAGPATSPGQTP